jgi:hypothetical protein
MAQANNTESQDTTNVYIQSFRLFCEYVEKYFPDTKEILLEENALTTKGMPAQVGDLDIRQINQRDLKAEIKKKSVIYLTRIVPLRMKDGEFFINIIPFEVTYEKKNLHLVNGGAFVVNYKYDCETESLILKNLDGGVDKIN